MLPPTSAGFVFRRVDWMVKNKPPLLTLCPLSPQALNSLVEQAYQMAEESTDDHVVHTYILSPYFSNCVEKLLSVAERCVYVS